MGTEQIFMMIGATVAGTFFAFSMIQQNTVNRNMYLAIGIGGVSLIAYGYMKLSGM